MPIVQGERQVSGLTDSVNHHLDLIRVGACRIHCAISTCLLSSKDTRSALIEANKAVEIDAQEPMCWMAKMHAERANGNIAAAIRDAQHIADLDPDLGKDLPRVLQQLQAALPLPGSNAKAL